MTQTELWDWMMEGNYPKIDPTKGDEVDWFAKREHRTALATIARPVTLSKWQGHGKSPEYLPTILPAGSRVKVVMASRFGDVGITDDLNATHGYHARIECCNCNPANENLLTDIEPLPPEIG